jgi:hypothetical protein
MKGQSEKLRRGKGAESQPDQLVIVLHCFVLTMGALKGRKYIVTGLSTVFLA